MASVTMNIYTQTNETVNSVIEEVIGKLNATATILTEDLYPEVKFEAEEIGILYMVLFNVVGGDLEHFVSYLEEIEE